jgi:hypothetical protein
MKTLGIFLVVAVVATGAYILFMQPGTESAVHDTNTNSQAKVDMNAVCEGALVYMSFPDGAAAEAWVTECKNGEHPEAIDQWKQQNGYTDDRAI